MGAVYYIVTSVVLVTQRHFDGLRSLEYSGLSKCSIEECTQWAHLNTMT